MMDEDDAVRKLSRLELRKQKLMEYLAAKGKLKPTNPKPYLRDDSIKHRKPEGRCSKTCNPDEGKENQGGELPRLRLAEKKPQPSSAGTSRAPLSANVISARATGRSRFPAPAATYPAGSQTASAAPGPSAPLAANKGRSVAQPIRAGSATVTSSRNGAKAKAAPRGRAAAESQGGVRPVPAAAPRTAEAASASSKTGPTAAFRARTRPSAPTQPRLPSAKTQPGTGAQTKLHSNTTAPARAPPRTSAPVRTCSDAVARPRTGRPAAAASSKAGPGKAPTARGPPGVPVPTAPTKRVGTSLRKASDLGSAGARVPCVAVQSRAAGPPGRAGPASKPVTRSTRALHGPSLPNTCKVSLTKAARGAARPSALPAPPQRPALRAAAPQWGRPPAPASRAGDGLRVGALQRAVRQAVSEMRGEGGGKGPAPNRKNPRPAPSGRVDFTGLQTEREPRGAVEREPRGAVEREPRGAAERVNAVASTVPRTARPSCQTLRPADLKTPARTGQAGPNPGLIGTAPPRDRKLTTAQEQRLQKLHEWRQSKGISYKRPPMPVRARGKKGASPVPLHYWTAMEEEEEAQSLVYNIDRSLTDCVKLLQEGCPSEQVVQVLSGVPMAKKFAKYWICQARLMEREGNLEVLPMFEEAVRVVLEPVDALRAVVFEILKRKEEASAAGTGGSPAASEGEGKVGEEEEDEEGEEGDGEEEEPCQAVAVDPVTPRATTAVIRGEKGGSSVVKYKITATPGGRRSQQQEPVTLDGQELRFFTPVRRSVRIERSAPGYPSALREHDPCVASFRDLLAEEEEEEEAEGRAERDRGSPLYVYRENEALRDQVQIQLCLQPTV
ncbi:cytoskeleton-associated protein 2-like [Conger conger]|uniref:cytoskeleton-associated protein 2-like n=1 Tax=Conger conger TaxID=82655 RepID=UPI002A5A70A4|nr:cytoskeleton-associated protein 2-like [Conger conger]